MYFFFSVSDLQYLFLSSSVPDPSVSGSSSLTSSLSASSSSSSSASSDSFSESHSVSEIGEAVDLL